jgi:hypothetical protein
MIQGVELRSQTRAPSAGHSRARCGSCVLCALDRFGLLDNWDGDEARGELSRRCVILRFVITLLVALATRAEHPKSIPSEPAHRAAVCSSHRCRACYAQLRVSG